MKISHFYRCSYKCVEIIFNHSKRLSQYHVVGLPTNIQFLRRVAESDEFQNAELDTGFIERHEHKLIPKTEAPSVADIATAAMVKAFRPPVASIDPFDLLTNWKVNQERVFF